MKQGILSAIYYRQSKK